jgi:uncharacterized protein YcbK (DUF882 family)
MTDLKKLTIKDLRRKNFAPEEFVKSETAKRLKIDNTPNLAQLTAGIALANKMQQLRDAIGKPFDITSGFRSPALNKAVGGSKTSRHMQFLACDFNIEGMEPHEAVLAIKETKISVDKVFVERGCVHMQTYVNDAQNRNIFASAFKNKKGDWVVLNEIKKMA